MVDLIPWSEVKKKMDARNEATRQARSRMTNKEFFEYLKRERDRPKMKGRKFKARIRSDVTWWSDPVLRCKCGHKSDHETEIQKVCPFGNCNQLYCPSCGREGVAWGPVNCPCERGGRGHQRYSEQPKPHVPRKGQR